MGKLIVVVIRKSFLLVGVACAATLIAFSVQADPMRIVATPQESSGPFIHNVFHSAASNGGQSGAIKAWIELDAGETSTWDSMTGELSLHLEIFTSKHLTTKIGEAHAVTSADHMAAAEFNDLDDVVLGEIDWTVSLLPGASTFRTFLEAEFGVEGDDEWEFSQKFFDHHYVTSSSGYSANSWDEDRRAVTLWGADGAPTGGGMFDTSTTHIGTDLVFEIIPAPGAATLGMLGLGVISTLRRRTRSSR